MSSLYTVHLARLLKLDTLPPFFYYELLIVPVFINLCRLLNTYGCLLMSTSLLAAHLPTHMPTFHSLYLTYCSNAYQMPFTIQYSHCMPRKTLLMLTCYCTVLSLVHHFDVHDHNTSSHFVIKRTVKLNVLTEKQYQHTAL